MLLTHKNKKKGKARVKSREERRSVDTGTTSEKTLTKLFSIWAIIKQDIGTFLSTRAMCRT